MIYQKNLTVYPTTETLTMETERFYGSILIRIFFFTKIFLGPKQQLEMEASPKDIDVFEGLITP